MASEERIRIGIASFLLGQPVRFDGGHAAARRELIDVIHDCGRGLVPLVVPLTLIRHYVRQFDIGYLQEQTYLDPHPKELMLRNHV